MRTVKLSRSIVGAVEKEAVGRVIDGAYLGMGKTVQEFEAALKDYIGGGDVVCVNSGTAALHLACLGIGLVPGDEVLVQSLTFVASFQAISASGAVPVACEVDPLTCTIDLKDAVRRLTPRTRAIMPVHYAGRAGDIDAVYRFAQEHGLRVIEDAAHAFGTTDKGRRIGSFGDVVCFSFDGIKNITTGEGGAVVTRDAKVLQAVMDARLLGVHKDTEKRYAGQRSWEFDVLTQGYRYHMSNIFAAIGLAQLARLEKEFKPARQKLAMGYDKVLRAVGGIRLFPCDYDVVVPHIFPIMVLDGQRDALRQHLIDNGVECGVHYYPNHLLGYYGKGKVRLPVTERVYGELLTLPLHPDVCGEDLSYVIGQVQSFFTKGA